MPDPRKHTTPEAVSNAVSIAGTNALTEAKPTPWKVDSWLSRPCAQQVAYANPAALAHATSQLRAFPPLVTSGEVEHLRVLLAEAESGKRFLLHAGPCAESLADSGPGPIADTLKVLLQMSMVLMEGLRVPVILLGRVAGQYAKPRTSTTETRTNSARAPITLPSHFGDMVNLAPFDAASRTPDPALMVACYQRAALTLNFIRALVAGGFADMHHPEYWDLSLRQAGLPPLLRTEYEALRDRIGAGLGFAAVCGLHDTPSRPDFFTSHEGLNLWYEAAQTRTVPRREHWYNLSAHLAWIGERTRQPRGAHVEFFRGVRNPVGVKLGPSATPADLLALASALNPGNEQGRMVFITRLGAAAAPRTLPPLLRAAKQHALAGLWVCDPMHANTRVAQSGHKTRAVGDILRELAAVKDAHEQEGVRLGGVHLELTGEDVTECTGGAGGIAEEDLPTNYASACDPRLNYHQAMETAFFLARMLRTSS